MYSFPEATTSFKAKRKPFMFKSTAQEGQSQAEELEGDNGYMMQKTQDWKCSGVTKRTDP